MKIKTLELQNFHGFEEKKLDFSDQFTVLIGDNGIGKTALLDGLSVGLGGFLSGLNGIKTRHILDDEVHIKKFIYGNTTSVEQQYPVKITCTADIGGQPYKWVRSLNGKGGKTTRTGAKKILKYAEQLQKEVRAGKEANLPVIAYFGTERLGRSKREKSVDPFQAGSRFLGYTDCLDPVADEKLFARWFKKMTLVQMQKGTEIMELQTVRQAIESCLSGIVDEDEKYKLRIEYNVEADEIQIALGDEKKLPFRILSSGYRNMAGMVADIAFRMVVLNPHLGDNVLQETSGVVLIDEIDLHLHPKWQRHVVSDLKSTFPKTQFIVTTHSPFIIQSLEQGELRVLDDVPIGEYVDKSIEDVTENVMGIELPQWSERRKKMYKAAEDYFKTLREIKDSPPEKLQVLREQLDELSKPFADNVAFTAFLEQKKILLESKMGFNDETGI